MLSKPWGSSLAALVLLTGLLGHVVRAGGDTPRRPAVKEPTAKRHGAPLATRSPQVRPPEVRPMHQREQRRVQQETRPHRAPSSIAKPPPELTYRDVLSRFSMPDDPQEWVGTIEAWFDEEDVVGPAETSLKLFNALERCSGAPRDAADLERRAGLYRLQELYGLRAAGHAKRNIERTTLELEACSRITELVPEAPEDLLATAAELGLARAQVKLATEWVPSGFETWSAERQRQHREEMGELLLEALHRCEPSALLVMSTGANRGYLWDLPPGPSSVEPSVEQYAYRLAFGLYQARETRSAADTGALEESAAALRSHVWSHLMTQEDVRLAEELGREVFSAACAG